MGMIFREKLSYFFVGTGETSKVIFTIRKNDLWSLAGADEKNVFFLRKIMPIVMGIGHFLEIYIFYEL